MYTDPIRSFVSQKLSELGKTMKDASLEMGASHSYLQQYLKRGIPHTLPEDMREKLAKVLGVNEKLMKEGRESAAQRILDEERNKKSIRNIHSLLQATVAGSIEKTSFGPDMVPVFGVANGSSEALVLNFDEPIGEIIRHPNQIGMKGSFALYTSGESMYPRYMSGDPVYAISGKPPSPGQDCIVEMNNGDSFVKHYLRKTDKEIICKQFNPERDWKRLLSDVKAIHAVVGRG